jgi:two-component system, sensor histidine kinase and response regulator
VFDAEAMLKNLSGQVVIALPMLESLLTDVPERQSALTAALAAGDGPSAQREAHTLKGLAGNGGAPRLQTLSWQIEVLCREGRLAAAGERLAELDAEAGRAIESWREYLARNGR